MHTKTFSDILRRTERDNAQRLMERAALANRLAKSATQGDARRRAYRVKTDALHSLSRRFPKRVQVERDPVIPSFVVVLYRDDASRTRFGLHAPAAEFAAELEHNELALEK